MGRPQELVCMAITNPYTKKPISVESLQKHFAHEISVGQAEVDAIAAVSLVAQMKKGNVTSTIWYTKNRWGWRDGVRFA
jgi:hypothetical protein